MWETIVTWFAKLLLEMALKEAISKVLSATEQAKLDAERGAINDANVQKLREAKTRAARIKAATGLLNGTRAP